MSESREYYSRSEQYGDVYISEEVLEMIAGAAALEVDIIPELAKKVQEAIVTSVEATSGLKVAAVNVRVGGVTFDKPEE